MPRNSVVRAKAAKVISIIFKQWAEQTLRRSEAAVLTLPPTITKPLPFAVIKAPDVAKFSITPFGVKKGFKVSAVIVGTNKLLLLLLFFFFFLLLFLLLLLLFCKHHTLIELLGKGFAEDNWRWFNGSWSPPTVVVVVVLIEEALSRLFLAVFKGGSCVSNQNRWQSL